MLKLGRLGYIYNANAPELIELFLVAAVAAVLVIRAFLALTGYPQIGGDGLHIAHMLWGGLFMLLAMLLLFVALGRPVQRLAAILGGVGFGTFVDELGKFITDDNNYFYEPTIGLIYIIFIAIFLVLRAARARVTLNPDTAQANAFILLASAAGGRMDAATKEETLRLLSRADTASPLVRTLTAYAAGLEAGMAIVALLRRYGPAGIVGGFRYHRRLGHLAAPALPPRGLPLVRPGRADKYLCYAGFRFSGNGVCRAHRAGGQPADLCCAAVYDRA